MLIPISTLEGVYRNELFSKYGIEVLVIDKRIAYTNKNSNWQNTSYFCWKVLPDKLIFEKIEKDKVYNG